MASIWGHFPLSFFFASRTWFSFELSQYEKLERRTPLKERRVWVHATATVFAPVSLPCSCHAIVPARATRASEWQLGITWQFHNSINYYLSTVFELLNLGTANGNQLKGYCVNVFACKENTHSQQTSPPSAAAEWHFTRREEGFLRSRTTALPPLLLRRWPLFAGLRPYQSSMAWPNNRFTWLRLLISAQIFGCSTSLCLRNESAESSGSRPSTTWSCPPAIGF